MIISSIVAVSENGVIGAQNDIPWNMPTDMKYFMDTTKGHVIVMGRLNFESLGGKALPNRTNIIITRNGDYVAPEGCFVVSTLDQAVQLAQEKQEQELFIIGGAQIYALAMPIIHKLYLTRIHATVQGDVFFPDMGAGWVLSWQDARQADEKNPYDYTFEVYKRE
jgi:dihydrofolate reductase